jgi:formylglycine-generating enzyme required for sulfatase activity
MLTYIYIPPGNFIMGCSPDDNECSPNEKPAHPEQIMNGFWLGQTEVTQAAWRKVMSGENLSTFKSDQLPFDNVTWAEASRYCAAIGGRLPTDEEWEYAARGGTTGARYGSLDAVAWYAGNSGGTTHPVGLKRPNAFGLYDMLGNVWEWVSDSVGDNREYKVLRGGSQFDGPRDVRVSFRNGQVPILQDPLIGFRCVEPSTWEAGRFPRGQEDYPVSGVSWYEASAYAAFVGKSLPALGERFKAAPEETARYTTNQSNCGGRGAAPVGLENAFLFSEEAMAGRVLRLWCMQLNSAAAETRSLSK